MLVGVNYTAPEMVVPDAWHHRLTGDLHSGSSSLESWWRKFNDSTLNRLVDRARKANPDLKLALERVTEARAARGVARSQLFPTVNAGGDLVRSRTSESLLGPVPPAGKTSDFWDTGFDAGWEIDFFGGVRRSIESATASEEALEEAYRDATVSLLAEVALNYVEFRTLDERIRVARQNIARQEKSLQLTRDKEEAGLVSKLNVSQIETTVRTSETLIPLLQAQRSLARNRLGTLVGGYPGSIDSWLGSGGGVPMPSSSAGVGIPADLIRSRPDIRAAERQLAAQTARIGVADRPARRRFPRLLLRALVPVEHLQRGADQEPDQDRGVAHQAGLSRLREHRAEGGRGR
jgi:NodT family efflux transporter outer membrane factor (OMF) lipoprotein